MSTNKLTVAIGLALVGVGTMVFLPAMAGEKAKPPHDVQRAAGVRPAAPSPAKSAPVVKAQPVASHAAPAALAESEAAVEAQEESARRRYTNLAEGYPAAEKIWQEGVRGRIGRVQKIVAEHKPAHKPAPQSQPVRVDNKPKAVAKPAPAVRPAAPASQPRPVPMAVVPAIGGFGRLTGPVQAPSLAERCRRAAEQLRALADQLDRSAGTEGNVVVRPETVR